MGKYLRRWGASGLILALFSPLATLLFPKELGTTTKTPLVRTGVSVGSAPAAGAMPLKEPVSLLSETQRPGVPPHSPPDSESFSLTDTAASWSYVTADPHRQPLYIGVSVDRLDEERQVCTGIVADYGTVGPVFVQWHLRGKLGSYAMSVDDKALPRDTDKKTNKIIFAFANLCEALMKRQRPSQEDRDLLAQHYIKRQEHVYRQLRRRAEQRRPLR